MTWDKSDDWIIKASDKGLTVTIGVCPTITWQTACKLYDKLPACTLHMLNKTLKNCSHIIIIIFFIQHHVIKRANYIHTLFILVLREVGSGLATSFLLISVPAAFGGGTLGSSSGQLCLRSLSVNLRIRFRDGFMIPNQFRGWPPEVTDNWFQWAIHT